MALTPIFVDLPITFSDGEFLDFEAYFPVVAGEKYTVIWDGEEYVCTAEEAAILGYDAIVVGNKALIEDITATSEPPFILGVLPELNASGGFTSSTEPNHIVSLYQGEEEKEPEPEPSAPVGIVIKDRNGTDIVYPNISTVKFRTSDGGEKIFNSIEAEETTIDLDFSDGDMEVLPDEDKSFSKVTIPQPENLAPENILEGVNIAGVDGSFAPDVKEELPVTLDFSSGDMEITADEGKAFSKVSIPQPETLLPENIAEGVNVAGVLGTLAAGGGGGGIVSQYTTITATGSAVTLEHNLGVVPDIVIAYGDNTVLTNTGRRVAYFGCSTAFHDAAKFPLNDALSSRTGASGVAHSGHIWGIDTTATSVNIYGATDKQITFNWTANSGTYYVYLIGGLT